MLNVEKLQEGWTDIECVVELQTPDKSVDVVTWKQRKGSSR